MVMLMHSTETRWICKGELPGDLLTWFAKPLNGPEKHRKDIYLRLDGCATTGVKLRQGNFEIKGLSVPPQVVVLGPEIIGLFDSWIKWSLTADQVERFGEALCSDAPTISVGKTRWLRKISLDRDFPMEVAATEHPDEGCNIELTAITVDDEEWWTFGFEAFGPPQATAAHLIRSAAFFLARQTPSRSLLLADALSYPAWISRLRRAPAAR
jgi:hypothetical protein